MSPAAPQVIVAGGGPAGLAAAHRLQAAGASVRVLESDERAGSKLASRRRGGFLLDRGAIFVPTTYRRLLGIAAEIGLGDSLVESRFSFGLVAGGRIHELDATRPLAAFARFGGLSARGKLACAPLALEALRSRTATASRIAEAGRFDGETLGAWADRRLSTEVGTGLVDGIIRGIFAAEADAVSRVDFLAILALFAGARLVAFRDGMTAYAEALAGRLDVRTGTEVLEVVQRPDGAEVTSQSSAGERTEQVDGCVVALPARRSATVRADLDAWRRDHLGRVRTGSLIIPNVGLARRPDTGTTYTLVPRREHPFIGGIGLDHLKAPGRAPADKGLVAVALMNDWCERHRDAPDDEVAQIVVGELGRWIPGADADVEFVEINRWEQQYCPVGHYGRMAEFARRSAAADHRVQLAGEHLAVPNLNGATASGEAAAGRLARALGLSARA